MSNNSYWKGNLVNFMQYRLNSLRGTLILCSISLLCAVAPQRAQADPETYSKVIADRAPAIVTLKFIITISGTGVNEEQEQETTGMLISNDGLVICSNYQIGGNTAFLRAMGMGNFNISQSDMRVLIGKDTEGVTATVIARDSELDLAWIKIDEPMEEGYPFVDPHEFKELSPGSRLFSVSKLPEFFGRTPIVNEGRVAGVTEKPRVLFMPSATLNAEAGIPVFTEGGSFAGLVVLVTPEEADLGLVSDVSQMVGMFILPASEVARATERAREAEAQD